MWVLTQGCKRITKLCLNCMISLTKQRPNPEQISHPHDPGKSGKVL